MLYREKYAFGGLRINREYPDPAQICDMLQIYPGIDGVPGAYTLPEVQLSVFIELLQI